MASATSCPKRSFIYLQSEAQLVLGPQWPSQALPPSAVPHRALWSLLQ